ncbi:MAG: hypothetical protein AABY15_04715 [Nanoarchaeota archaeon]
MENIWNDFDDNSKTTIKDLVKNNQKLNHLITKLQKAKNTIDGKSQLITALKQQIKK